MGDGVVVTRSTPTTSDALAISSFRAAAAKGPVLVRVFGSPVAGTASDRSPRDRRPPANTGGANANTLHLGSHRGRFPVNARGLAIRRASSSRWRCRL